MDATPADDNHFLRLEVLRCLSEHMKTPDGERNVSPFESRVAVSHGAPDFDIPQIHEQTRGGIKSMIKTVSKHGKSRIVLLAGAAGNGKTHILNHFSNPDVFDEIPYFFVGMWNQWSVGDFHKSLLGRILAVITKPSDKTDDLATRIEQLLTQAVRQLLEEPAELNACLKKTAGRAWWNPTSWFRQDAMGRFRQAARTASRSPVGSTSAASRRLCVSGSWPNRASRSTGSRCACCSATSGPTAGRR